METIVLLERKKIVEERERLEKAAEEKRKQAQKIIKKDEGKSKKNSSESGGRLGHQKTIGSKQKKMHNAAKSIENKIAALEDVEAPENSRSIKFCQSTALELHNPYYCN